MAFDSTEITVLGFHEIFTAPVGSTFPTSVDDDPTGIDDWVQLGRTTDAGARFTFDRKVTQIFSSQFLDPARSIITAQPKKVEYDLQQWNDATLDLALGGVDVTTVGGETRLDPKALSFVNEKALLIIATDGDDKFMVGFARTLNTKATAFALVKTAESFLPIGSEVLGSDGETPYFLQSNALALGS